MSFTLVHPKIMGEDNSELRIPALRQYNQKGHPPYFVFWHNGVIISFR